MSACWKFLLFALSLPGFIGCAHLPAGSGSGGEARVVIVEVAISHPGAAAGEVKQGIAAPVVARLSGLPEAEGITSVSETDGYRAYLSARSESSENLLRAVRARLPMDDLPAEARLDHVSVVPAIPTIPISCQSQVVVDLDSSRLAAYGLTAQQVLAQIPRDSLAGTDDEEAVGRRIIRIDETRAIRLEDVASLYVTCGAPSTIVEEHALR